MSCPWLKRQGASALFLLLEHRRGATASFGSWFYSPWDYRVSTTMPPPRDDRYICISPTTSHTDSEGDDAADEPAAATPIGASNEGCQQVGNGLIRLPAVTPRISAPGGVGFQQLCDGLRTELPGDSTGRGSFDTRANFVAGDPGAKFGATAPLEYETIGEVGHPHWGAIFEYILRQCGYLLKFHTVYVMVDNRNLADHKRQDATLPHWPAAARWWHSRLKLIGPDKEKTELLFFPISETTGLHQTPHLGGHLCFGSFGSRVPWTQLCAA